MPALLHLKKPAISLAACALSLSISCFFSLWPTSFLLVPFAEGGRERLGLVFWGHGLERSGIDFVLYFVRTRCFFFVQNQIPQLQSRFILMISLDTSL